MLSDLEQTIIDVAVSLHSSQFAHDLQQRAPGRRAGSSRSSKDLGLADFELNLGIPVQRTLHVLEQMHMGRYPAQPSDEDREYVLWVRAVHDFLRAVGDRFWTKVPEAIRSAFFDDDNIPTFATTFIPGLRDAKPPDLHTTAERIGLSSAELARLGEIWGSTRNTPAGIGALAASSEVRSSRKLYRNLVGRTKQLRDRIWAAKPTPTTVGDYARWVRETVRETASGDHPTERKLRAYNQLIQVVLATILGLLEDDPPATPIDHIEGRVAISHFGRVFGIRLTSQDTQFLHPGEPFVVLAEGPLDGIYQCTAFSLHLGGGRSLVDLQGRRLSDLEQSPV